MEKQKLAEYFEEVETIQEYNGYFYSIPEAVSTVVLGSICGLRNISQIHQWAESDKAAEFMKEEFGIERIPCYYWLLSLLKLAKPESLNKCLMKWAESMPPENRIGWLEGREKWSNLAGIGVVFCKIEQAGKVSNQAHYFICVRQLL